MLYDEIPIFTNKQIRDQNNHFSTIVETKRWANKSVIIHNTLDVAVNIRWQGAIVIGFGNPLPLEPITVVNAGSEKMITTDDLIPFMRLKADCDTTPTSGAVDAWAMGEKQ